MTSLYDDGKASLKENTCHSVRNRNGFSVVELLIVVAIMMIMIAVTFIQIGPVLRESKAQTALQTTLGQMRRAHEMAIDQRQVYRLTFTTPGKIQLDQVGFDPLTKAKIFTFQSSILLPTEIQFAVVTGIPTAATKVPEGFGAGAVAIDFDQDFGGGTNQVYFQRDGTATDDKSRLNNGVIYMCRPGDVGSCKAVSLMGATGRSKGWRLNSARTGWMQ